MISGALVNVLDFGATGDGVTDDTLALQSAIDAGIANKNPVYFPPGKYRTTAQLTATSGYLKLIGSTKGFDNIGPVTIMYDGTIDTSVSVLKVEVLKAFSVTGIEFSANRKAGMGITVSPDTLGGSSYGYVFDECVFEGALHSGFRIIGTSNGARFNFKTCDFRTSKYGFYSENPNSLSHSFVACSFANYNLDVDSVGIYMQYGSFSAYSCEFATNYIDAYLHIINAVNFTHCWSEQSRRFIYADNNSGGSVTLTACVISSFPWSWWKIDETNRTQPTNNYDQWAPISFDRQRASLTLNGCQFNDPFNGATVGSISPTTASGHTIGTIIPNSKTYPINVNNIGSYFQIGTNTYTETDPFIVAYGSSGATIYQRNIPMNKIYSTPPGQSISGAVSYAAYPSSIYYLQLTGSATLTPAVSLVKPGDRVTYVLTQGNGSANTITFKNSLVSGGSAGVFSPTVGSGKISTITFEFTGISGQEWVETGQALDVQVSP